MRVLRLVACLVAAGLSVRASAQSSGKANEPAPRALPAPNAVSPRFLGSVFNIRALPGGDLLINDVRNHHIMRSDSLLKTTTVVIDSGDYGSGQASLLGYPGDSLLFVEAVTPSMRLFDPSGNVVRTMAVPQPRDAGWLMPSGSSMAGVDARGRLIHRGLAPRNPLPPIKEGEIRPFSFPDSTPVVRDDPGTHRGDTLTWIHSLKIYGVQVGRSGNRSVSYSKGNPLPVVDEWTVLSNGLVAVLRGRDYHVDMIDANGKVTPLPRIPFVWEPLSDSAKVAVIDSVRADHDASQNAPSAGNGRGSAAGSGGGSGGLSSGGLPPDFPPPPPGFSRDVSPSEINDYRPAFGPGALTPDLDGNVWIRTSQPVADQKVALYDIVDATGKRRDRVLVPKDRRIVGFDRRGNVYLVGREDGGVQFIERVRWR